MAFILEAIKMALDKPASVKLIEVDIIHRSLCQYYDTGNQLDCTCTPEIKERLVN